MGNGLSLVGTWMTNVATAWLIFRLTGGKDSPMAAVWLGYVAFASQAPLFLLSPFAGVIVDRRDKRKVLIVTQILSLLQSAALAMLVFSRHGTPVHVLLLALVQGLINAFDVPARQSFVVEMIENRDDFSNAIAMNSMMFNLARLIGPAMAGLIIARWNEGVCFTIDAVSYLAVVISLLLMNIKPRVPTDNRPSVWTALKEGMTYAFGFPPIRTLILFVAAGACASASLPTLLPLFASSFWPGHGERVLGILSSCIGGGALCGAIYLASRKTVVGLGRVTGICAMIYGAALMGFAFVPNLYYALPVLAIGGAGFMVMLAGSNTVLQSMVDDDKRGRVMSLFSMAVLGTTPLGALVAGKIAQSHSPRVAIIISATIAMLLGVYMIVRIKKLRPLIRPVYVKKGIIKEIAIGMEAVDDNAPPTRDLVEENVKEPDATLPSVAADR